MTNSCRSLRNAGGLPPRRDAMIEAADTSSGWGSAINVPMARDRMLDNFEREMVPGDVKSTLAAALNGDLHQQHLLFTAMIDTWPKLQKGIDEIARKVSCAPWKVHPFAARGDEPTPKAEKLAKDLEAIIWGMKPRPATMENGLEATIQSIVRGYYYGHSVEEIRWDKDSSGGWFPRCTKHVSARFYGYPYGYESSGSNEDRLMFDPTGMSSGRSFEDFPENRFLISIRPGHSGHPSVAAPLRALAGYWLAAVYGLKWFMNFTQLYGVPWLHAQVSDAAEMDRVSQMISKIGSSGRIVTKTGVTLTALASPATGASLPQAALIALADQQCDQFILGQTLTGGTDDSGSRALGEVHQGTLDGVIDGVADFVGGVLTHQFIPAIIAANYGDSMTDGLPEFWAKREEVKDEQALADRDKSLREAFPELEWSKSYLYERHSLPVPVGDDVLVTEVPAETISLPAPDGALGEPETGVSDVLSPHETKGGEGKQIKAAYAAQPTIDDLSAAVLEDLTGVSKQWLGPVKPFFERLAALAMSKHVTDEDFLIALEKAQKQLPEIFAQMDAKALEDAFVQAMARGAILGSVSQ